MMHIHGKCTCKKIRNEKRATCSSCLKAESKKWYITSIVTCLALVRTNHNIIKLWPHPQMCKLPFKSVTKTCTFFNTHLALFFQMNRVILLFHIWSWQNTNTLTRSPNKGAAICLCVCPYYLLHVWVNASQVSVITKQKFCKD